MSITEPLNHQPTNLFQLVTLLLIVLALALPRGLALNRFATPDEPLWLMRSANFFEALAQGQFENTYQQVHPGVTTMWAGALGYLLKFPDYVKYGPGQQANSNHLYKYLQRVNGPEPLNLLAAGRIFVVVGIVVILSLAYLYARKLLGFWPATIGFIPIVFDPFSIGLTRLLHTDGLMSALLFLSLLAFFAYHSRGNHVLDLLLSGVAAGLAWLTKSPALFLIPFVVLLEFWEIANRWKSHGRLSGRDLWAAVRPLLIWGGTGLVVCWLFWPALWVDPVGVIRNVFTGASKYAAEGHTNQVFFNGHIYTTITPDWNFYPISYLWRATPITLIGLLLSGLLFRPIQKLDTDGNLIRTIKLLAIFGLLFAIFISFSGKKFDRYLLPVFLPLDLIAGIGWWALAIIFSNWIRQNPRLHLPASLAGWGLIALVSFTGLAATATTYPYYLDYYNPMLGGPGKAGKVMMLGWGEGLDQAAKFLNQTEEAKRLKVLSWYGDGPFSYFFSGTTLGQDLPTDPAGLPPADYLVLYVHEWQRKLPSSEFLDYFALQEPVYVVNINQIEYARIYRIGK